MVTLAGDLDFFAPRVATGVTAVLLTRFDETRAWDVLALTFLLSFHFRNPPFIPLIANAGSALLCLMLALLPNRYCGNLDLCAADQSGYLDCSSRWFGIRY